MSVLCLLRILQTAALAVFPVALLAQEFYVAPTGSDANPGTQERPLAGLIQAQKAARAFRATHPDAPCRIVLKGGTYRLEQTVVFELQDHDLEIISAPGETAVLSGAWPLPGPWRQAPPDLARLPEKARGHVWVADLPEGWPVFRTLFHGDRMLHRARSRGMRQLTKPPAGGPAIDLYHLYLPNEDLAGIADVTGAEIVVVPSRPWVMNILPIAEVDRATGLIRTAVPATYPLGPPTFADFPQGTVWIENVPEALDEPGEWVLDTTARKLYLWPLNDQEPGQDIVVPRLTELIRVEGRIDDQGPQDTPVRGVVFRGLTFTQSDRWPWEPGKTGWGLQHDWEMFDRPTAMLRFRGAEACRVEDCRFVHSGSAGVRLDLHCQHIAICHCEFGDLGGAGVLLAGYGMGTKDVNRDNLVADCHVHHIGKLLWHSAGIWAWQSGHNRIEHNHVHHTPYTAILVTGRTVFDRTGQGECSRTIRWHEIDPVLGPSTTRPDWQTREPFMHARENLVAYNDIHDCMEVMDDGNAIYVSGCGKNNRVVNNFIHDIPAININASIRCDDDQHETLIENNVITRVCGEGFIWKGKNTIVNNIIYDLRSTTPDGRPCGHQRGYFVLPSTPVDGSIVQRNILVSCTAGQTLLYERARPVPTKPQLQSPALFRSCLADNNVYWNTAEPGWGQRHIAAQRAFGIEQHSVEADPKFLNPAQDDFRLAPDSPALQLGFQPIEIATVGPRPRPPKAP